jgi:Tfp pilus assembly protein PilF
MPRWGGLAGILLFCLGGCTPALKDRVRDYNEDGLHLYTQGSYAKAAASFEAALALQPEDPDLLYNAARCQERIGDRGRAEHFYTASLQKAPNHAACRHGLAALLVQQGRQAEAVQMVEDWLAREPGHAAAYAEDGWLWHQAGDLPRAQARLQQALELNPHENRALVELALVYEAMQYPERALVLYERALAQNPNQPEVLERMQRLQAQGIKRPRPE